VYSLLTDEEWLKHKDAPKHTLCGQNPVQIERLVRADTHCYPHYLLQYIPVEEDTCLFELLGCLKTFQRGFPTLRAVLVASVDGGGWV